MKPRDPGRRETRAGRESPEGSACTAPTRSYGDRRDDVERASGKHRPSVVGVSVCSDGYPNPGVSASKPPLRSGSSVTCRVVCFPLPYFAETAPTD